MVLEGFTCIVPSARTDSIIVPLYEPERASQKYCHQCRKWKSVDDFNNNRARHDGKCSECRECEGVNKKIRRGKSTAN